MVLRSPCTGWTARNVVTHVVDTPWRALSSVQGPDLQAAGPEDDLLLMWGRATGAMRGALDDPIRSSTTVGGMFGEQPFESLAGRRLCSDTLIHTWDLARATGQDESLDEDAATKALEFLTPLDGAIRRPGGFAAKIEPSRQPTYEHVCSTSRAAPSDPRDVGDPARVTGHQACEGSQCGGVMRTGCGSSDPGRDRRSARGGWAATPASRGSACWRPDCRPR